MKPKNKKLFFPLIFQDFQGIIIDAPVGVFVFSPEGRYLFVNLALASMYGYESPEKMINSVTDISKDVYVDPKDWDKFLNLLDSRGQVTNYECRTSRCDGSELWVSKNARAVNDCSGKAVYYQVFVVDVTRQKQIESSLRNLHRDFLALLENTTDFIYFKDQDRRIRFCSQVMAEIAGHCDWNDIIGKHDFVIFPEELARIHNQDDDYVLKEGSPILNKMFTYYDQKGCVRWALSNKWPVFADNGQEIVGMFDISRDITELKQAEESLLQAQQQTVAANKSKSEFLANMSHEIRTPLNGISGILQLLASSDLTPDQKSLIDLGITSSRRLTKLLSDILDLSYIETGKVSIRENEFNVKEICDSLYELFIMPANEKGISLTCSFQNSLPDRLVGDDTRLYQILVDIVGNAVKYTEKGHVSLEISSAEQTENDSLRVLFSVSDTGIGIPDDKLNSLFQPFTQTSSSYSRDYQGAGLGLALAKKLVKMIGGDILIKSKAGKGTTVEIVLPFKLPNRDVFQVHDDSFSMQAVKNLKILLAEDDPVNQIFIKRLLEDDSHKVVLAKNGKEAVEKFFQYKFDCVLMDIQMPVMTGIEAAKAIRRATTIAPVNDVPIIAVTACAQPNDREKFLKAGMDDYLGKPVSLEDFQRVFNRFFGDKEIQT